MTSEQLCVLCRTRPIEPAWRPFCSERCKLVDLARWAGEEYRIPAERIHPPSDADGDDHKG